MADKFLDKVYDLKLDTTDAVEKFYDDWSDSYDSEVGELGYASPRRLAEALVKFVPSDTPILDFGCGTGLSGRALNTCGFTTFDGMDISDEMLEGARATGLYRNLTQIDPDADLPFAAGDYPVIVACGVIGAGAAPLAVFDTLMNALATGGYFAFSYNDHTLEDPSYEAKVMDWCDTGAATLLFREHGDHLPGLGLGSNIYVMQKN